jgi:hypothetical protein
MNIIQSRFYHDFCNAYLECALWSSTDENGEPLDDNYTICDVDLSALQAMQDDCKDFIESNEPNLILAGYNPERAGHDFWLTRNSHGAGFWDRGLGDVGDRLSDSCKPYGSCYLHIGDDGKIYAS